MSSGGTAPQGSRAAETAPVRIPTTMQAWRVEQITDAGAMVRRRIPVPQPAADQYLVRVEASGLAFGDTLVVRGKYQVKPPLPFTPGSELVGTIVAGDGGPLAIGTRIASSSRQGGFAEYTLVPRSEAVALPDGLAAGAALALRSNYPTSLYALREVARLQPGETLLVHAGAGGVGSAAVALGRWLGARYLVIGFAGGTLTALPANRLLLHNATAHGVLWGEVRKRDLALAARLTRDVYDAFGQGRLAVLPGRGYDFARAPEALAALEGRGSVGKLWLQAGDAREAR